MEKVVRMKNLKVWNNNNGTYQASIDDGPQQTLSREQVLAMSNSLIETGDVDVTTADGRKVTIKASELDFRFPHKDEVKIYVRKTAEYMVEWNPR